MVMRTLILSSIWKSRKIHCELGSFGKEDHARRSRRCVVPACGGPASS